MWTPCAASFFRWRGATRTPRHQRYASRSCIRAPVKDQLRRRKRHLAKRQHWGGRKGPRWRPQLPRVWVWVWGDWPTTRLHAKCAPRLRWGWLLYLAVTSLPAGSALRRSLVAPSAPPSLPTGSWPICPDLLHYSNKENDNSICCNFHICFNQLSWKLSIKSEHRYFIATKSFLRILKLVLAWNGWTGLSSLTSWTCEQIKSTNIAWTDELLTVVT